MPKCNHSHGGKKADGWTNFSTLNELLMSLFSNFMWGASIGNDIESVIYGSQSEETNYLALILGISFSLLAFGPMLTHRDLFIQGQDEHSHGHSHGDKHDDQHTEEKIEEELTDPLVEPSHESDIKLSKCDWAALGADFASHIGELAGVGNTAVDIIAKMVTGNSLSPLGRVITQCGTSFFGAGNAVANWRVCRRAMEERKKEKAEHAHRVTVGRI